MYTIQLSGDDVDNNNEDLIITSQYLPSWLILDGNQLSGTPNIGIANDIKNIEYQYELTGEKIALHKKYIEDMKKNKNEFINEKSSLLASNEEEIFKKKSDIDIYSNNNRELLLQIKDDKRVNIKYNKLKDIQSQLKEKHRTHNRLVNFFENNEDCPTCQQHIDEIFKSTFFPFISPAKENSTSSIKNSPFRIKNMLSEKVNSL